MSAHVDPLFALGASGFVDLFHLLRMPAVNGSTCQAVTIPDTVVYHRGLPLVWYFTSKDGCILRKHRIRLRGETVVQGLVARADAELSPEVPTALCLSRDRAGAGVSSALGGALYRMLMADACSRGCRS